MLGLKTAVEVLYGRKQTEQGRITGKRHWYNCEGEIGSNDLGASTSCEAVGGALRAAPEDMMACGKVSMRLTTFRLQTSDLFLCSSSADLFATAREVRPFSLSPSLLSLAENGPSFPLSRFVFRTSTCRLETTQDDLLLSPVVIRRVVFSKET